MLNTTMLNNEALEIFKMRKQCCWIFCNTDDCLTRDCCDCPYYVEDKALNVAIDVAIDMFEKSTPKKVTMHYEGYDPVYVCPHCGAKYPLKEIERTPRYFDTVCEVCHGVMDWGDIDYSEDLELEW